MRRPGNPEGVGLDPWHDRYDRRPMDSKEYARRVLPAGLTWRSSINLYSAARGDETLNFGDQLAPIIVRALFDRDVRDSTILGANLVAVGSLLEGVEEIGPWARPHIWGTGYIKDGPAWRGVRPVRFKAVRGELTRSRVQNLCAKLALGDPAILMGEVYPDLIEQPKRFDVSVVPHFVDYGSDPIRRLQAAHPEVNIVNVLAPAKDVAAQIAQSRLVLSSSLHGLIVADAFDVPSQWTPMSDDVIGGGYKFEDYYSAFGESAQAMELGEAMTKRDSLRAHWERRPDFDGVKRRLVRAFPVLRPPAGSEIRTLLTAAR